MKPARHFQSQLLAFFFSFICHGVLAADEVVIASLRPPRGELRPGFWEQYWLLIAIVALVVLVMVGLLLKWLRRLRPTAAMPPAVLARRDLETLRGRPEDAALVTEVSRILRQYIISAFFLPRAELTTAEFHKMLPSRPQASATLTAAIYDFLRRCDERKFAPTPPISQMSVVDGALALIEHIEIHQKQAPGVAGFEPRATTLAPSTA